MSILSGKGKIKLDGQKGLTKDKPILSIEAPDVVYIPLVLGTATDFDVHVKEGDHVCIGTKLATRKSMYVPIYSSVSGTVKGIEKRMHASKRLQQHIVIENDHKNERVKAYEMCIRDSHGSGAIQEIPNEVKARGFHKAMVCSDPDLIKFGVTKKVTDLLDEAGLEYVIYSDIKANPTIENVQHGVKFLQDAKADYMIAIGGGSSMDTAKAIGIIDKNPEFADVRSLEGVADTKNPCTPILAVPTTAGTAAEVTINYVITDAQKDRKMVCVDPHDLPIVAFVDPDMMSSMPKGLTAATGMDALTHAIEGYITAGAWEMSDMFHLKAIELIAKHLRGAVENTPEGREGMALGQYIAGMGFSNVGLGIVHSMAHPLGALYDTPHGVANAIILPTVMAYNAPATGTRCV